MSATGIAALEAGRRRAPRPTTVALLLDALHLEGDDRQRMVSAAANETLPELVSQPAEPPVGRGSLTSNVPELVGRSPFVGRDEQLVGLRAAWETHTRLIVVAGEAGVGKSRIVAEPGKQRGALGVGALGALHAASARFVRAGRRSRSRRDCRGS